MIKIIFKFHSNFYFPTISFLPSQIRFIHFHCQSIEKFQHFQAFQLIEIDIRFVENVYFLLLHYTNVIIIQENTHAKVRFQYWNCSSTWVCSENLLHILRAAFPKNTSGRLLLCFKKVNWIKWIVYCRSKGKDTLWNFSFRVFHEILI